jgi:hypothetical protein
MSEKKWKMVALSALIVAAGAFVLAGVAVVAATTDAEEVGAEQVKLNRDAIEILAGQAEMMRGFVREAVDHDAKLMDEMLPSSGLFDEPFGFSPDVYPKEKKE